MDGAGGAVASPRRTDGSACIGDDSGHLRRDLDSGVAAAQAAAGDTYVNVLGARIARQSLDAGVLDEIFVRIAPVLLCDGVRLFDHQGGTNVKLERLSPTHAPLATNIRLRIV
ncbi:MAG: hypothetical protein V7646_4678 [Pseudonocardia sp.]|nr:hypothetical protein [Pseudonocardia sp.]